MKSEFDLIQNYRQEYKETVFDKVTSSNDQSKNKLKKPDVISEDQAESLPSFTNTFGQAVVQSDI